MKKSVLVSLLFSLFFSVQLFGKNVKNPHVYAVVLAGGSGSRLWPLSRENYPKQFLSVCGGQTLLQQAVDRVGSLIKKENIWIGSAKKYEDIVLQQVGGKIGRVVLEPSMRNTAPAILLSCFELYKKDPDSFVIFLPSDPFIPDTKRFSSFLERAIDYVQREDRICLVGLRPQYPATEYGYIEYDGEAENKKGDPFEVKSFHEKPVLEVALRYCGQENMLWNISMFCGRVSVFLEEFKKWAPGIFEGVQAFSEGSGSYDDVRAESIDFAVMEKSKKTSVIPADFEWSDVGSLELFLALQREYGVPDVRTLSVSSNNNMVHVPKKFVALVGVENLCVVETDDVLLISNRGQAKKIKQFVQKLKKSEFDQYL